MQKDDSTSGYLAAVAQLREDKIDALGKMSAALRQHVFIGGKRDFLAETDRRLGLLADNFRHLARKDGFGYEVPLPAAVFTDGGRLKGQQLRLNPHFNGRAFRLDYEDFRSMPAVRRLVAMAQAADTGLRVQLAGPGALALDLCEFGDREMLKTAEPGLYDALAVSVPPLAFGFDPSKIEPRTSKVAVPGYIRLVR